MKTIRGIIASVEIIDPEEDVAELCELTELYNDEVSDAKCSHVIFEQFAKKLEGVRTDGERRA